ncbi:MAG: hypothetical protein AB2L14_00755 [Candidatus Xenobiia bacterium LiM19]
MSPADAPQKLNSALELTSSMLPAPAGTLFLLSNLAALPGEITAADDEKAQYNRLRPLSYSDNTAHENLEFLKKNIRPGESLANAVDEYIDLYSYISGKSSGTAQKLFNTIWEVKEKDERAALKQLLKRYMDVERDVEDSIGDRLCVKLRVVQGETIDDATSEFISIYSTITRRSTGEARRLFDILWAVKDNAERVTMKKDLAELIAAEQSVEDGLGNYTLVKKYLYQGESLSDAINEFNSMLAAYGGNTERTRKAFMEHRETEMHKKAAAAEELKKAAENLAGNKEDDTPSIKEMDDMLIIDGVTLNKKKNSAL